MRLSELYESNKNLGQKIYDTMGLATHYNKVRLKTPKAKKGPLPGYPHHLTSPVPTTPRLRKYFGLDNTHSPY